MESGIEKILGVVSRLIVPYVVPTLVGRCDFFNTFNRVGPGDLDHLAEQFGFDKRVFECVLYYLTKEGYVTKSEKDDVPIFDLSDTSKNFLLKNSTYDLSPYVLLLNGNVPEKVGDSILFALQTGEPATWDMKSDWEQQMKDGTISKVFSQGMMSRGKYLRDALSSGLQGLLSERRRLIDVGGSLGDYCGKFTEDYENLESVVFELPAVAEKTRVNIQEKGYSRVSVIEGDMFTDDFPKGFDIFLYSNAIHDWNDEQIKFLFKKTFGVLEVGGAVVIHDCHLEDEKVSPVWAVDHSLYLSIFTKGRYYSYNEMKKLLAETGFERVDVVKTVAGFSAIVGYKN